MKIDEIPLFLKPIEEKADLTNAKLELISTLNKIPNTVNDLKPPFILNFIDNSSFMGKLSLYICTLSSLKSKPFDLIDFKTLLSDAPVDYIKGYIVAVRSFGLMEVSRKKNEIIVKNVNQTIQDNILASLIKAAKVHDDNPLYKESPKWESDFRVIENYFNNLISTANEPSADNAGQHG